MKILGKKLFCSLLFFSVAQGPLQSGQASMYMPQPIPQSQSIPIPSIDELFAGMSEEELVRQIKEAKQLFASFTPQEMEDFAKLVEQSYNSMSEQDKNTLQDISNLVQYSPYNTKNKPVEETSQTDEQQPTKIEPTIDSNSIQNLIDSIKYQIDDIAQKVSSSKSLTEAFNAWTSKISFENLKRLIFSLKEDRLAKKLVTKTTDQDKELAQALEDFYKQLKHENNNFNVEDTFGLAASSKKQDKQQVQKFEKICVLFEHAFETLQPKIEAFLKTHDPEVLELAKEAQAREKKAKEHAADAQIKRGSAPAIPEPDRRRRKASRSSYEAQEQYMPPYYYDQNMPQQESYGRPSAKSARSFDESMQQPIGTENTTTKKVTKDKKEEAKKEEPKEKEKKKKEISTYDQITNALDNYFEEYSNSKHQNLLYFLQHELPNYPSTVNHAGPVANDVTQQQWLDGTGAFENNGYYTYTSKMNNQFDAHKSNPVEMLQTIDFIKRNTPILEESELQKLADHKKIKDMKKRTDQYADALNAAHSTITKQYHINTRTDVLPDGTLPNTPTFLNGIFLNTYNDRHNIFMQAFNKFKGLIEDAKESLVSLNARLKREIGKTRAKKERAVA